eukprot:g20606.t1
MAVNPKNFEESEEGVNGFNETMLHQQVAEAAAPCLAALLFAAGLKQKLDRGWYDTRAVRQTIIEDYGIDPIGRTRHEGKDEGEAGEDDVGGDNSNSAAHIYIPTDEWMCKVICDHMPSCILYSYADTSYTDAPNICWPKSATNQGSVLSNKTGIHS